MTQVKNLQGDTLESSTKEEPKRSQEAQELYDNWTVSASGLSEFARTPRAFRAYKEKADTENAAHFTLGTAVHCRLLEPETFDEKYYVMDVEAPGDGTNMRIFIDRYFWYTTNEFAEEQAKELAYQDSGYKTKFDTVWKNFEEKENYVAYWNALNDSVGKIILTPKDEFIIEEVVSSVKAHKVAAAMLDVDPLDNHTYMTEETIEWDIKGFDFNMKSILDRVRIDHENKLISIIDIKTTSKNVHKFAYSYENFAYYRQMAFYGHAMMWYVENVLKEDKNEWALTTSIIAVQTTGFYETVVYAPSPEDMMIGHNEIINLLTKLSWHYETNNWDYPLEYYTEGGIMPLALDLSKYGVNGETGQNNSEGNENE